VEAAAIDRSPWAGFSGTFYFGEVAAGTGSFIRYASELGMECLWFSEKDEDLHAAAQAEAGPTAECYGDLLLLDPLQLPEVPADGLFLLIGGPECQPFSRAGKGQNLYDLRARTLLWIVWCLAVRQFDGAFVENVENLLYIKGGRVMGTILALLEGLGYQAVPAPDSPISHGIPHARDRVFISILRSDHADKWGLHAAKAPRPQHVFTPIEDMLLPADHELVVAEFAAFDRILRESGLSSALVSDPRDAQRSVRDPVLAWKCGDGSFGCRGFTNAVPAIKVFGEGP
jgi:site-specific DNA-cytosine methylase